MKLLLVLTSVVAIAAAQEWERPAYCKGNDCPKFTVITSNDDYEERMYETSRWVSHTRSAMDFDEPNDAFMRLFRYIDGNNDRDEIIDMTSPVINRITPGNGPSCRSTFTNSFYISEVNSDPPKPRDETVFLQTKPEMRVYVRHFGGFATMDDYITNAQLLAASLPETASYHTDFWYRAGYDNPVDIFNRRNEVWFIGK